MAHRLSGDRLDHFKMLNDSLDIERIYDELMQHTKQELLLRQPHQILPQLTVGLTPLNRKALRIAHSL
jgi:hypothetical protein